MKKRKIIDPEEQMNFYRPHIGHRVQYYFMGTNENYGKLERVSWRQDFLSAILWLKVEEGKPLVMIEGTMAVGCNCGNV